MTGYGRYTREKTRAHGQEIARRFELVELLLAGVGWHRLWLAG